MREWYHRNIRQKNKKIFILKIIFFASFLFVVSVGASSTYKLFQIKNKIHVPLKMSKLREGEINIAKGSPFSVLMLGIDPLKEGERGRSDTIMVATVNPNENSVKLTSIPRDYRTILPNIPNSENEEYYKDKYVKLNAAYAYGGIELAAKAIENIFDIPIDYYIVINMDGFVSLVDAVGGINIENEFKFSDVGYTFEQGNIHLSGLEALAFSRMRKKDPKNGDYGRQQRQRNVVLALFEEVMSLQGVKNINEILNTIGDNVTTNFDYSDMWQLGKTNFKDVEISTEQLRGSSEKINGIDYEVVAHDERVRIIEVLRTHLELELNDQSIYNE